jgi:hypothetical protein
MVFSTEYIQHLGYNKDLEVTSRVLGDVIGLQFVVSVGGICAIKLISVNLLNLGYSNAQGHTNLLRGCTKKIQT